MEELHPDFSKMTTAERLRPQEEMLEVASRKTRLTIGVPREVSNVENRVSLIPDGVGLLVRNDHQVLVESGAGLTAHFPDHEYSEAGAQIVGTPNEVYKADLILKVGPVTNDEIALLHPKQTLISALQIAMQCGNISGSCAIKRLLPWPLR